MKADPEVKMISAEAPILFAKGCEIFITELTMRAWIHAEENKRRTLQRSDIASALTKSDMFDFLIDVVPREDAGVAHGKRPATQGASTGRASVPPATQQNQENVTQQPQHQVVPGALQTYEQQHLSSGTEFRSPALYGPTASGEGVFSAQEPLYDENLFSYIPGVPESVRGLCFRPARLSKRD